MSGALPAVSLQVNRPLPGKGGCGGGGGGSGGGEGGAGGIGGGGAGQSGSFPSKGFGTTSSTSQRPLSSKRLMRSTSQKSELEAQMTDAQDLKTAYEA